MARRPAPPASVLRLAGRVGGLTTWTSDRPAAEAQLADARRAFRDRFPDEQSRRLFYAKLALASARSRAKKKASRARLDQASSGLASHGEASRDRASQGMAPPPIPRPEGDEELRAFDRAALLRICREEEEVVLDD